MQYVSDFIERGELLDYDRHSRLTVRDFLPRSLHEYVFGAFAQYMTWFVEIASGHSNYVIATSAKERQTAVRFLAREFEILRSLTRQQPLVARFVAEYVQRIRTSEVKSKRVTAYRDAVKELVVLEKRYYLALRPDDALQTIVRDVVAHLVKTHEQHQEAVVLFMDDDTTVFDAHMKTRAKLLDALTKHLQKRETTRRIRAMKPVSSSSPARPSSRVL